MEELILKGVLEEVINHFSSGNCDRLFTRPNPSAWNYTRQWVNAVKVVD